MRRPVFAIAMVSVLLLSGCTLDEDRHIAPSPTSAATFDSAVDAVVRPSGATGGTLKLLAESDCDSWDPARTSYGWCLDMQRLISRTLVNYSKVNGRTFELSPDLATSMGVHDAAFTEWTYTLRPGLRYSDGSVITARDIKYAVERNYAADVITGGRGRYLTALIDAPDSYQGPYRSGDLPDSAIEVSGDTISFHLKRPFADFDALLALPVAAPVPRARDTGAEYTNDPVSSGPFRIDGYVPGSSVVFVRNSYWTQSTDAIRRPRVQRVELAFERSDDIDDALQSGAADARMDSAVGPALRRRILASPRWRARADDPVGASIEYIAIPSSVAPFENVHCRRAVFYALDKAAVLSANGGDTSGSVAHSAVPPGVLGYDPSFDPYPGGSDDTGDVARSESELKACGRPDGFTTKYAYPTPDPTGGATFIAVKASLARVGITVTSATASVSDYYSSFVGSPESVREHGLGLIQARWGAELPTPFGLFSDIVTSGSIRPLGNSNYASIADAEVDRILDATQIPSTQARGQDLDHALMRTAQFLPILSSSTLLYRSPRLTNVTSNNALGFGAYDVVDIGVNDDR